MRVSLRTSVWLAGVVLLGAGVRAPAAELEKYFPSDTKAVLTVNVKQMLASPLVKDSLDMLRQEMQNSAEAQQTLTALGFDPLKDLDSVAVAVASFEDRERLLFVFSGRFNPTKFKATAEQTAKNMPELLKIHAAGDRQVYEVSIPNHPALFVAVVDGTTLVASHHQARVTQIFDIKAGKTGSALNKDLKALLAKADAKQTISLAVLGGALGDQVPHGDQVENINGGITLTDGIRTNVAIQAKNAEAAKMLADLVQMGLEQGKNLVEFAAMTNRQLAPLAGLVNSLKVSDQGNTVTVKGEVDKAALDKLKKGQ